MGRKDIQVMEQKIEQWLSRLQSSGKVSVNSDLNRWDTYNLIDAIGQEYRYQEDYILMLESEISDLENTIYKLENG